MAVAAQNVGVAINYAQAGPIGGDARDARPMTEMENLSETMGENRRRLLMRLTEIESMLNSFAPEVPVPTPIGLAQSEIAEPSPGTLACLRTLANTTGSALNRLDAIRHRLSELL